MNTIPTYSWSTRAINPAIYYFTNHHDSNAYLTRIQHGPLGFDLEWRPAFRRGQPENRVALVQLATADTVFLFHIHLMTQFPAQLARLLYSPSWVKVGVNIQYDCKKLYRDYGVSVRNCVELSLLARTVDNARWKGAYTNQLGLSRLLETYEQAALSKGAVQRSNWEQLLTPKQRDYAANDAHAGYIIYSRLINMARAMSPVPPSLYYSFSVVEGHLLDHLGIFSWNPSNPHYDPGPTPPPKHKDIENVDQERRDSSPVTETEPTSLS